MQIGLHFPSSTIGPDPVAIRDFAQTAEGLGYDHLATFEHVLAAPPVNESGHPQHRADTPYHEAFVLFGFLAACTSRIGLSTAIVVLPQRQAALAAKQVAEVDILSGGRMRLGVGIGRVPGEYQAMGQAFGDRGRRLEEQIQVMRALWTQDHVHIHGKWHDLHEVGLAMLPVQQPIPIWMGGSSDRVLDRIGRLGDGWITSSNTDRLTEQLATIRAAAAAAGRDPNAIGIEGRMGLAGRSPEQRTGDLRWWEEQGATHVTVSGSLAEAGQLAKELGRGG